MSQPNPSGPKPPPDKNLLALLRAKQALRLVCGEMPHHVEGFRYVAFVL